MHIGFVCDACGFTSSEEKGNIYYCPQCGNQMHPSKPGDMLGNGGDANAQKSVWAWDILFLILVGGLSFGVMNWITYWTNDILDIVLFIVWLVLFIIVFVKFHQGLSGSVSDKAVKK